MVKRDAVKVRRKENKQMKTNDRSNEMPRPRTAGEAQAQGYEVYATAYQRGYVSRRGDNRDALVYVAGGSRAGEMYYLAPSMISTQYCLRMYIRRKAD